MIGKPIETYSDYVHYIESDRWFLSMTRLNEFRKRDPAKYEEFQQKYQQETHKAESLGYRVMKHMDR